MVPSRSSRLARVAGSCSMPSARPRTSDATSSSSASRPARRSASASNRGSRRAKPRDSRTAIAAASRAPAPSAVSASRTAAAPRAIASPCWAADSRARISSASPGRSLAAAISSASCSRRSTPPRQLARVDRQLRQRGPVRAPALDHVGRRGASRGMPAVRVEQVALPALVEQPLLVVLAVDLDQRPDLVGEPGGGRRRCRRAGRSTGRSSRPRARRSAAPEGGRTAPRPAPPRRRGGRGSCPRAIPATSPRASISRLLPAPVSPVMTFSPGPRVRRSRSISARSPTVSSRRRPALTRLAHEGSNATLWRSRSQNGCAPSGSMSRIGRSTAWTSTTSPTRDGMSSRPSTETRAS